MSRRPRGVSTGPGDPLRNGTPSGSAVGAAPPAGTAPTSAPVPAACQPPAPRRAPAPSQTRAAQPGSHRRPAAEPLRNAALTDLLARLAETDPDTARWRALRSEIVARHLGLVRAVAGRFQGRGEDLDDLVQVGTVGLIKAIDRYDAAFGAQLSSFAVPTIAGEIKRHLRDQTRTVRLPRRIQERQAAVAKATTDLYQRLGRSPTVDELAAALVLGREEVLEALDGPPVMVPWDDEQPVAEDSQPLEDVEHRAVLRPLLEGLDPRLRRIVVRRFFDHRTQSEIAAELGVSQVQVSRLLTRALGLLRSGLARQG